MSIYTNYTRKILLEHGWYPDRVVNLEGIINTLSIEGFITFDIAINIIQNLQGLELQLDKNFSVSFNALDGLGTYEDLLNWINENSINLYPIGTWPPLTIYIGDDQKLYLTDFEKIARIDASIKDGMEALISRKTSQLMTIIPPNLI